MNVHDTRLLMELQSVSVRFGINEALKNIDLPIHQHEICAIVGDNGAGKSTLVKVLSGYMQPSGGSIVWKSQDVSISNLRAANALGIASVFQHPEFCENLDVAANLFLGKEISKGRWKGFMRDDSAMYTRAKEVLNELSSSIRVASSMQELSLGQRQTVAIAQTLLTSPELIVLDEPTAMLSVIQTAEVLSYMKRLREQGLSMVFVSHDLPDVFAVADRVIVMRLGRVMGDHKVKDTSYEEVIAEISGVIQPNDLTSAGVKAARNSQVNRLRTQHKLIERALQMNEEA
ncbi:ATP-binding cassette domain-containing protein [Bifidobacterium aquikefiri]|uniref:ABC transporter ATP-binding protein n=1 Tax=Bifidobacterium aquikefiri TaxID=1653207 RepID=A0A261G904_9BIFI|nr:ATP-binding cassette domain-containing protein [Bifidobacterium aquikefiri]OZG67911.1 ABC transporter ATP-binding protein [Bifidobacterium aquikefiri]